MEEELIDIRRRCLAWVIDRLKKGPPISVRQDGKGRRYHYLDSDDQKLTIPDEPGVYVFYSKHGDAVYVGESDSIQRRMGDHCTGNDKGSVLRTRWAPCWMKRLLSGEATTVSTRQFVHDKLRIKWIPLSFGRAEIEEDLKAEFNITKPEDTPLQYFQDHGGG